MSEGGGRFKPGFDPRRGPGRPQGAVSLARAVAEATNDGQRLVDELVKIAFDPSVEVRDRLAAMGHLLNRGFGAPVQISTSHVVSERLEPGGRRDLRELSDVQLAIVRAAVSQLEPGAPSPPVRELPAPSSPAPLRGTLVERLRAHGPVRPPGPVPVAAPLPEPTLAERLRAEGHPVELRAVDEDAP